MSRWRDWAQLVRIPNTLTAAADSLAGFSLVAGPWLDESQVYGPLALIGLASIALYWAGMVLNDVNDVEKDKAQRRYGPLVAERIPLSEASAAGWLLLIGGVAIAALASWWIRGGQQDAGPFVRWLPVSNAVVLAIAIKLYDSPIKQMIWGPWLMGLCRSLNFLLGASLGFSYLGDITHRMSDLAPGLWMLAFGHGLFVVGLTSAARKESMVVQSRMRLASSWSVSAVGLFSIAFAAVFMSQEIYLRQSPTTWFPVLVGLLAVPWALRAIRSIQSPNASILVPAIKQSILTIVFLDAAIALQFAGDKPGLLICSFAIPTFLMGRYFRMT
jgi:4-hydroxybenzoate polyprenyltransferase